MLSAAGSDGAPRRARGALESAVMDVLWQAGRPLSPGEVRDALATSDYAEPSAASGARDLSHSRDLSYSTVVTILTRLHAKKMLARTRVGRSFQYAPLADEAGLAARRLTALLDGSADREAVLSRFVADLPDRDEEILRRLLGTAHSPTRAAAESSADAGERLTSAHSRTHAGNAADTSGEGGELPGPAHSRTYVSNAADSSVDGGDVLGPVHSRSGAGTAADVSADGRAPLGSQRLRTSAGAVASAEGGEAP